MKNNEIMVNILRKYITFSPKHLKIFFGTCIAIFIVVALQLTGIKPPKLILPTPQKSDVFFDTILPKLEKKQHSFNLKKNQSFFPVATAAHEFEDAAAFGVIDYDSGEILLSKNSNQSLPIASLTKIMTSVVALDLADTTEDFKVSKKAARMIPTKIGIRAGEQLQVTELLSASLMTSANDAVEVIREGIDSKYGAPVFIRSMNEKAQTLGMTHTSFTNPQGFDSKEHYSSVEDLAILTHYALESYPLIAEIARKDYLLLPADNRHKQFDLFNWNGLIGVYPNTIGVKIGYTEAANKTTIVVSERHGKKLIAIVLGAPGILERDLWAAQLLDAGYQKSLGLTTVNVTKQQLQEKYDSWKYWN